MAQCTDGGPFIHSQEVCVGGQANVDEMRRAIRTDPFLPHQLRMMESILWSTKADMVLGHRAIPASSDPLALAFGPSLMNNTMHKYCEGSWNLLGAIGTGLGIYSCEDNEYKECYAQAEEVYHALLAAPAAWQGFQLGRMQQPGHYWAAARHLEAPSFFVHMDPWKEKFWVSPNTGPSGLHINLWDGNIHIPLTEMSIGFEYSAPQFVPIPQGSDFLGDHPAL